MATPTTAIQRYDMSLTRKDFDLAANRAGFIGTKVYPPVSVAKPNAEFTRITVSSLLKKPADTTRAPKTAYGRTSFEFTTDNYSTSEKGREQAVDDAELELYGEFLPVEMMARDQILDELMQDHEQNVANAVFDTARFTGAATVALSNADRFSNHSVALPIDVIKAGKRSVRARCGRPANCLVVPEIVLDHMVECSQIIERIKYSGKDDPKDIGINELKKMLRLEHILVADGFSNTKNDGQTPVFGRHWDPTMLMVCRISTDGALLSEISPCIGRTVMWQKQNATIPGADNAEAAIIFEEYREENVRGGVIRGRWNWGIKDFATECGYLVTNVTDGTEI